MNCSDYAESLEDYLDVALKLYQQQLQARNISIGKAVQEAPVTDTLWRRLLPAVKDVWKGVKSLLKSAVLFCVLFQNP